MPFVIRRCFASFYYGDDSFAYYFDDKEFTQTMLSATGWRAKSEVIYIINDGVMISTGSYRLIIDLYNGIHVWRLARNTSYALFENAADGGTEIVIFFPDEKIYKPFPILIESIPLEPSVFISNIMPITKIIHMCNWSSSRFLNKIFIRFY